MQTVVAVNACTPSSVVLPSPQSPDAANDRATMSIVPALGSFTVTDAASPRTDRTFAYAVVG